MSMYILRHLNPWEHSLWGEGGEGRVPDTTISVWTA